MTFNEYQKRALSTETDAGAERSVDSRAFYTKLLGLIGETGEIAEKFKKIYRDNDGHMTEEQVADMKKELGDVLWYIATVAAYLDIELQDIADFNIEKLASRQKRGKLQGSGDNR